MTDETTRLQARVRVLEDALRIAQVHVANNAQGWSVGRGASRDDLAIVDAALAASQPADPATNGSCFQPARVKHIKRGSTYRVIGAGKAQTGTPLHDYDEVVIYQDEADGRLWVRPTAEFGDGRFEPLEPADPVTNAGCCQPVKVKPQEPTTMTLADAPAHTWHAGLEMFQARVHQWMMACFGSEISADRLERGDRLLEEVFELLQSGGYPRERVASLTSYVWSRPIGEPAQEVGGVMVTLAAYCQAHGLDMHDAAETELARIWTKIEKIRAKRAAKPLGSALPMEWPISHPQPLTSQADYEGRVLAALEAAPVTPAEAAKDVLAERQRQISAEGWSPEHDDAHIGREMAQAAACYALNAAGWKTEALRGCWPMAWASAWFKPTDPRRDLVKAGALIIAEIERLDRAAPRTIKETTK